MEEQKKLENILYRLQAQESCRNLIGKLCYLQATHESRKIIDLWSEREDTKLVVFGHIYNGAEGIKNYYLKDFGDREILNDSLKGQLILSEYDTEVIEVAENLKTAKASFLSQGHETFVDEKDCGRAVWSWNKIGADFIFENGIWKIWHIRWYALMRGAFGESFASNDINIGFSSDFKYCTDRVDEWKYTSESLYPENEPKIPQKYKSYGEE